jgi:signal transduction histidine kinase
MNLRTKLLGLLTILAVGPLLAIGLIGYALSVAAVREQLESQTQPISERAAAEVRLRAQVVESDLLLLAGNAETRRLLDRAAGGAHEADLLAALTAAEAFFGKAWELFEPSYAAIELRDGNGQTLITLGDPERARLAYDEDLGYDGSRLVAFGVPAHRSDGHAAGTVEALVRAEALLPAEASATRFGRRGVSLVVDRASGRVLHYADSEERWVRTLEDVALEGLRPLLGSEEPSVSVQAAGVRLVGWVTGVSAPPLDVVALADVGEFESPFRRQRAALFVLVLVIAAAVVPAGSILLRRATRSLEELTSAADRVGRGDFAPELPAAGRDEVGRLTSAFQAMVGEVSRMMSELERSRQLAAVGAFAAELSHEIRNPLTAVKLNLQRIQRLVAESEVRERVARPLEIALAEVGRLDRVVRSALRLGRADAPVELRAVSAAGVVARALATVRPHIEGAGVAVVVHEGPGEVLGDEEQLTGALVNLLLNAVEAMRSGGTLGVATTLVEGGDADWLDIHVSDTGGGIGEAARAKLFQPFFTTRKDGTGLGLALALRTAEAHGGTITLVRSSAAGSEFRLRLPLLRAPLHT